LTTSGATATTIAPTVTPGMTLTSYATALTNALATAGITGTTVTATAAGQLSITGANITTAGSLIQDPAASANAAGTLTFNPGQPGSQRERHLLYRTQRRSNAIGHVLEYRGHKWHLDHRTG